MLTLVRCFGVVADGKERALGDRFGRHKLAAMKAAVGEVVISNAEVSSSRDPEGQGKANAGVVLTFGYGSQDLEPRAFVRGDSIHLSPTSADRIRRTPASSKA